VKLAFAAAAAAGLLAIPGAVSAKPGDSAWAKCIWETSPHTAAAWLTGPLPKWTTSVEARESLLGYRLAATCNDAAANPLKPNNQPPWKAMAAALRKSKPKSALPAAVSGGPSIFLCESRTDLDGESIVYLYQIVRRGQMGESVAYEQHMTRAGGMVVKLPAGLRAMPERTSGKTCRKIGQGGELGDAQG
jgi:hypothetical protein